MKTERQKRQHEYYLLHRDKILAQEKLRRLNRSPEWMQKERSRLRKYRLSDHGKAVRKRTWQRYKKAHPDCGRRHWLKRYGLTPEDYAALVKSQGGVCAICKKGNDHPTRWGNRSRRLTVDHCHKSGKVRGLLCHTCNAGLGHFNDSREILGAAILYLSR